MIRNMIYARMEVCLCQQYQDRNQTIIHELCKGQPHVEPIKGKKSTACARLGEAARGGVEYSN